MKILSNELRTITIEGVEFTPDPKGVTVPADKEKKMRENFFFKHYVKIGSFVEQEVKTAAKAK